MNNKMKAFWIVELSLTAVLVYLLYFYIIPVTYTDRIIDGYDFHFTDGCYTPSAVQSGNKSSCVGWTYENKTIYIVTGRGRIPQYETCSHESLHDIIDVKNRTLEEEIVTRLAYTARFEKCDKLIV